MTTQIRITLTDAQAGNWTDGAEIVASGVRISEDRDYPALGDALEPHVTAYLTRRDRMLLADSAVTAWDPNATDLGDPIPGGAAVCVFRYLRGECEVMS
jgi:hypothetical protein